jgi:type IV secretion system protein VirD4
LVIQAPSQLREVYGLQAAETMLKSVAARIVFAPKDYADAKEISDELGYQTVKVRSHSRPSAVTFNRGNTRSANISTAEHARALLLPQEVKEIGIEAALIFYENVRPIRCRKIRYYADRRFRRRLGPPPPRPRPAPQPKDNPDVREPPERRGDAPPLGDGFEPEKPSSLTRAASIEDLERLDSLTLDDFGVAVKNLRFTHAGERPTESEFEADVQRFLDAVRS